MMDRVRWVRGRADPITARQSLDLPTDVTYLPTTDEIRTVVARDADGPVEETTESVADWAGRECARVGAGAVPAAIDDRIATSGTVSAVVRRGDELPASRVVVVSYSPGSAADGPDSAGESVDFGGLVEAAPRDCHTTVEFRDTEFTCDLPVFVERVARRERLAQDSTQ